MPNLVIGAVDIIIIFMKDEIEVQRGSFWPKFTHKVCDTATELKGFFPIHISCRVLSDITLHLGINRVLSGGPGAESGLLCPSFMWPLTTTP